MTTTNPDQSVDSADRLAFEAEARRQSLAVALRSRDPNSDDHISLGELADLLDADHFASEWKV